MSTRKDIKNKIVWCLNINLSDLLKKIMLEHFQVSNFSKVQTTLKKFSIDLTLFLFWFDLFKICKYSYALRFIN